MSSTHSPAEGIYRRTSVRMYGDEKFMRLSPVLASGQSLFIYVLTGPHTGPIPGVFVIGRASLAENLGWPTEAFDKAFAEVIGEGLAQFDAKTRLWFIPKALKHNMPPNPNVVRSWRTQWALLPECEMRNQIFEGLKATLYGLSEAFGKAFEEACGKTLSKPLPKDSPKQEAGSRMQKQHKDTAAPKAEVRFSDFWQAWPRSIRKGGKSECVKVWQASGLDAEVDVILAHVKAMAATESWTKDHGAFVPAPVVYLRGRRWDGAEIGGDLPSGAADNYSGVVL